jgi:hypothetical protein
MPRSRIISYEEEESDRFGLTESYWKDILREAPENYENRTKIIWKNGMSCATIKEEPGAKTR